MGLVIRSLRHAGHPRTAAAAGGADTSPEARNDDTTGQVAVGRTNTETPYAVTGTGGGSVLAGGDSLGENTMGGVAAKEEEAEQLQTGAYLYSYYNPCTHCRRSV